MKSIREALAKARFDVAIGVAVEGLAQRQAVDVAHEVLGEHVALEVRHRAGLGAGQIGGVAEHEDVVEVAGLEGVLLGGDEVELVAHARTSDHRVAHVQGYGHQQIVLDLGAVIGHDLLAVGIDLHDGEFGHHLDVLLFEEVAKQPCGARLGKRAGQRRRIGDLDLVAQALLVEKPVGQEEELQRCNRALDGHLDDVEHDAAALPGAQMLVEGVGAVDGVEVEDRLAPLVLGQARGLLRHDARAGGDDQEVVGQNSPFLLEQHPVVVWLDHVDFGDDQLHAARHRVTAGPHHVVLAVDPERDKQEAGLVVVDLRLIHDRDLPFVEVELVRELVGDNRAGGAGA